MFIYQRFFFLPLSYNSLISSTTIPIFASFYLPHDTHANFNKVPLRVHSLYILYY